MTASIFEDDSLLGFTGLQHALELSLWPGKIILWALFMLSLLCWSVILSKAVSFHRAKKGDLAFLKALNSGKHPLTLYAEDGLDDEFSLRAHVYKSGARELTYQLLGSSEVDETLKARIDRVDEITPNQFSHVRAAVKSGLFAADMRMRAGFGILSGASFIAPMIGLLGSSWLFMDGYEGVVEKTLNSINPELAAAALAMFVIAMSVGIPAAISRIVFAIQVRERRVALSEFSVELCKAFDRHFVSEEIGSIERANTEEGEIDIPVLMEQKEMSLDSQLEPELMEGEVFEWDPETGSDSASIASPSSTASDEQEEEGFESPFELVDEDDALEDEITQPHHQPVMGIELDSDPAYEVDPLEEELEYELEPPINPIAQQTTTKSGS